MIWHIDESKSNNTGECEYGPGSASCSSTHYMVALMQADNLWHLEKNTNRGDTGDPYPGSASKRSFTDSTAPGSKLWNTSASGVSITAISDSGSTMTATLSYGATSTTTTVAPTTTTTVAPSTTTTAPACIDNDGDSYGENCDAGNDCNDDDPFYNAICPDCEFRILPGALGWFLGERTTTRRLLVIGKRGTEFDDTTPVAWEDEGIEVLSKTILSKRFMLLRVSIDGAAVGYGYHRALIGPCSAKLTLLN